MNDNTATDTPPAAPAVGARLEPGVGRLEPERFCIGVPGRSQCDDCAGRYVVDEGFSVPPRILAHQPWPFEPCPHYAPPV